MYQLLFFETTNGDTVFMTHYSNAHFMNMDIVESDSETNAIALQYLIQIKTMNNITCTHSQSLRQLQPTNHYTAIPCRYQCTVMSYSSSYVHSTFTMLPKSTYYIITMFKYTFFFLLYKCLILKQMLEVWGLKPTCSLTS